MSARLVLIIFEEFKSYGHIVSLMGIRVDKIAEIQAEIILMQEEICSIIILKYILLCHIYILDNKQLTR